MGEYLFWYLHFPIKHRRSTSIGNAKSIWWCIFFLTPSVLFSFAPIFTLPLFDAGIVTSRVFKITDFYERRKNNTALICSFFSLDFLLLLRQVCEPTHNFHRYDQLKMKFFTVICIVVLVVLLNQPSINARSAALRKFSWSIPTNQYYRDQPDHQLTKRKGQPGKWMELLVRFEIDSLSCRLGKTHDHAEWRSSRRGSRRFRPPSMGR